MINWSELFQIHHENKKWIKNLSCFPFSYLKTIFNQQQLVQLLQVLTPWKVIYRKFNLNGRKEEWTEIRRNKKGYIGHHFQFSGDEFVFIWMILAVASQRKENILVYAIYPKRKLLSIHKFSSSVNGVSVFFSLFLPVGLSWIYGACLICSSQDTAIMLVETYTCITTGCFHRSDKLMALFTSFAVFAI